LGAALARALPFVIAAHSAADLTTTGTSNPSCARMASAIAPASAAAEHASDRTTALPLLSTVVTSVHPSDSRMRLKVAMGTLLALPTLTPRRRTTYADMTVHPSFAEKMC
jgi:hypothetical protein